MPIRRSVDRREAFRDESLLSSKQVKMTELPYIFEMDPEDWFVEIQQVADEVAEAIAEALDEYDNPEDIFQAVQPTLEPYIIDADDPTQNQILADHRGDTYYVGQNEENWFRLTYRDDGEYWWFKRDEPDDDVDAKELHRRIGRRVVESISWGDEDKARERAENQKTKRAIIAPYLHALEDAGGRDACAVDVRTEFQRLVEACLPEDEGVEVDDQSPDDDHTHLVIRRQGQKQGHVLAVSPGTSRKPERLQEIYGLDDISLDEGVLIVTDHLRFVWYPFLGGSGASNELILPAQKDEDIVEYYFQIDRTVLQMIRSLFEEV